MINISFSTRVIAGKDSLSELVKYKEERIFIVTDIYILESNLIKKVTKHLHDNNQLFYFADVPPDPPIEAVADGVLEMLKIKPTIIMAVGGGSPIDAAKAMKFFFEKVAGEAEILLISIPTTSGSGSEVTNFSVITDKDKLLKYPLVTEQIQPDEAYLSAELTLSVPKNVTADSGIDVLVHSLEAYVSTKATNFTDALCEKVIALVVTNLPICYREPDNLVARNNMHEASCLAGMAFNLTSLGLCHSIAHAAGTKFKLPHGRINALVINEVIQFNAGVDQYRNNTFASVKNKYAKLGRIIGKGSSVNNNDFRRLLTAITKLKEELQLPLSFRQANIAKDLVKRYDDEIGQAVLQDRCLPTNPRQPTAVDITQILQAL